MLIKVQKYETIYHMRSKDLKSNYIWFNSWKAIGEKFGFDVLETER